MLSKTSQKANQKKKQPLKKKHPAVSATTRLFITPITPRGLWLSGHDLRAGSHRLHVHVGVVRTGGGHRVGVLGWVSIASPIIQQKASPSG